MSAAAPPTGAMASTDGRQVSVGWMASDGSPTTYYVEVGTAPGRADIATLTTTRTSITYSAGAATYYMRVRAARGSAVSEPSNEVSVPVAPRPCTAAPLDPILLPASTNDGLTTISWLARGDSAADQYHLDGVGPSGPITAASSGSGTSLTLRLDPGMYGLRLTGANACGLGPASNQITFGMMRILRP